MTHFNQKCPFLRFPKFGQELRENSYAFLAFGILRTGTRDLPRLGSSGTCPDLRVVLLFCQTQVSHPGPVWGPCDPREGRPTVHWHCLHASGPCHPRERRHSVPFKGSRGSNAFRIHRAVLHRVCGRQQCLPSTGPSRIASAGGAGGPHRKCARSRITSADAFPCPNVAGIASTVGSAGVLKCLVSPGATSGRLGNILGRV